MLIVTVSVAAFALGWWTSRLALRKKLKQVDDILIANKVKMENAIKSNTPK